MPKSIREILEELALCYYECGKAKVLLPAKIDQAESQIKALIAQNYIPKDRLPSIKGLENIIEKTAVEYNKDHINPDFIWKCSLTDIATKLSKELKNEKI